MKIFDKHHNPVIGYKGEKSVDSGLDEQGIREVMHMLRDGLYSNKIRAVCREYASNAIDANAAAGKADVPILIHAPTHYEPWFLVRDYGDGLSEDEIFQVYIQYCKSLKRDTNLIGGKGIGANCAHSYTDTFIVTSFHEGVKSVYNILLEGEDGKYGARVFGTLAHREPSDEPSGIEVKITVDTKDVSKFQQEIKDLAKWYDVLPECNITLKSFDKSDAIVQGDGYFTHSADYYRENTVNLIVAQHLYPVARTAFKPPEYLRGHDLYIYFEANEIELTPSRESINHTSRTDSVIRQAMSRIDKSYREDVNKSMQRAETPYQAIRIMMDAGVLEGEFEWRGRTLKPDIQKIKDTSLVMFYTKRSWTKSGFGSESSRWFYLDQLKQIEPTNHRRVFYTTKSKADYVTYRASQILQGDVTKFVVFKDNSHHLLGLVDSDMECFDDLPVPPKYVKTKTGKVKKNPNDPVDGEIVIGTGYPKADKNKFAVWIPISGFSGQLGDTKINRGAVYQLLRRLRDVMKGCGYKGATEQEINDMILVGVRSHGKPSDKWVSVEELLSTLEYNTYSFNDRRSNFPYLLDDVKDERLLQLRPPDRVRLNAHIESCIDILNTSYGGSISSLNIDITKKNLVDELHKDYPEIVRVGDRVRYINDYYELKQLRNK